MNLIEIFICTIMVQLLFVLYMRMEEPTKVYIIFQGEIVLLKLAPNDDCDFLHNKYSKR